MPPQSFRNTAKTGCYLLQVRPTSGGISEFWGTFRLERKEGGELLGSSDQYRRPIDPEPGVLTFSDPDPRAGIPCFPRLSYRYYWELKSAVDAAEGDRTATLVFARKRWNRVKWENKGDISLILSPAPAPESYPDRDQFYIGAFKSPDTGNEFEVRLGWVDNFFRKVTVEIDHEEGIEPPTGDSGTNTWESIGESIGWRISLDVGQTTVEPVSGNSWSLAQLHEGMVRMRSSSDLDSEWRYHLLCVSRIEGIDRGVMFDIDAFDANRTPREGAAIAASWRVPETPKWSPYNGGLLFGAAKDLFFRTAVHEWGHTCNLTHDDREISFMATTDKLAEEATPAKPIGSIIQFAFSRKDSDFLKHRPDIRIRPGSAVGFESGEGAEDSSEDESCLSIGPSLQFSITPVIECIPLGAPPRFDLTLKNTSDFPVSVPKNIGFKSGVLTGEVQSGEYHNPFTSAIHCIDEASTVSIKAGDSLTHGVTLLRGTKGPLFPRAGYYRVNMTLTWLMGRVPVEAMASTEIMVTGIRDQRNSQIAFEAIRNPEVFLILLYGGNQFKNGMKTISKALASSVFKRHFEYIEARRRSGLSRTTTESAQKFAQMINSRTVMNAHEIDKVKSLVRFARPSKLKAPIEKLRDTLARLS